MITKENKYKKVSDLCVKFYKLESGLLLEAITYIYKEILNKKDKLKFEKRVLTHVACNNEDLYFVLDNIVNSKYLKYSLKK
jgi:hypothetical protein